MKSLEEFEWDFSKCPKNELEHCLFYELARECGDLIESVKVHRDPQSQLQAQSGYSSVLPFFGGGLGWSPLEILIHRLGFITRIDQWPVEPWLNLPKELRQESIKHPPGLTFLELMPMESNAETLRDQRGMYLPKQTHSFGDYSMTFAVIRVDWRYSRKQLVTMFTKWLDNLERPHKPFEKRGKGTEPKDLLRMLGAFRLLKKLNGNWKRAAEYSAGILSKEKPLYENQSSWLRAEKGAQKAIGLFCDTQNLDKVLGRIVVR